MPPAPVPGRAAALVALLGLAMVTATYFQGALSVLASFLLEDLGITRSQLGFAFGAFSLTGAFSSPVMGALTDRGPRRVMAGLFVLGAAGVVLASIAPTLLVLLLASVVGGTALGAGNPVTNRIISEHIAPERRGLVIGLKQAGPPLGLLAAGAVIPPLAVAIGWREALAATALLPLSGLIATFFLVPDNEAESVHATPTTDPTEARSIVVWLTVIGLGVSLGVSSLIGFLPLYAQERVGLPATTAGALAAFVGLTGVVGRIGWGNYARRFARPSSALLIMSSLAVGASLALLSAQVLGAPMLWVAAIGIGGSAMAWHAVAWLVIIDRVGTGGVGKASGIMQVGNSVGFAAGPPMVGAIVDLTGSYTPAWGTVAGIFAIATALTYWVRQRNARRRERATP